MNVVNVDSQLYIFKYDIDNKRNVAWNDFNYMLTVFADQIWIAKYFSNFLSPISFTSQHTQLGRCGSAKYASHALVFRRAPGSRPPVYK